MKFFRHIRLMIVALAAVCGLCLATAHAAPQSAASALPTVSLLTVGPGDKMYQLEGHTALLFEWPDGRNVVVNWGVFDFNAPHFAYRFIKGETDYMCGASSMGLFRYEYRGTGRYIVSQRLNLTAAETRRIVALVEENLRPENATYRYNYVLDNCSTRPLALIEKALAADGAEMVVNEPEVDTTFREEMRRYHRNDPWYQLFIDLTLGSGIDYPIDPRGRAFAPVYLQQLIGSAQVKSANGRTRQLVSDTTTLQSETVVSQKPLVSPMLCAALLLIASAAVTWVGLRRQRLFKGFDAVLYGFIGLLGCYLTFMIFVSQHEATSPNINYLWINPAWILVPMLIWSRRTRPVVTLLQWLNIVALVIYIVGQPFYNQSVGMVLSLIAIADLLRAVAFVSIAGNNRKPLTGKSFRKSSGKSFGKTSGSNVTGKSSDKSSHKKNSRK